MQPVPLVIETSDHITIMNGFDAATGPNFWETIRIGCFIVVGSDDSNVCTSFHQAISDQLVVWNAISILNS